MLPSRIRFIFMTNMPSSRRLRRRCGEWSAGRDRGQDWSDELLGGRWSMASCSVSLDRLRMSNCCPPRIRDALPDIEGKGNLLLVTHHEGRDVTGATASAGSLANYMGFLYTAFHTSAVPVFLEVEQAKTTRTRSWTFWPCPATTELPRRGVRVDSMRCFGTMLTAGNCALHFLFFSVHLFVAFW